MIISKDIHKFIKIIFLFSVFCSVTLFAQTQPAKLQRIGFVDIEYVLDKIPSYAEAQEKLNEETGIWKTNLDKMYLKLDKMRKEYLNEKPLLTEDLIEERETEIKAFEQEITKAENTYFGTEGKLFELRKKLVTPYQDLVYNAVQTIAKVRKYDMIFEKSSSIVMLYTNNNYDISELVLRYLQKSEREIEQEEAAIKRNEAKIAREKRIEEQRKKREALRLKREEERKKRLNK
ncbi:OmpH family outer membrane protein [Wenyingzhuangia sp. IMCC45533]